ncbi:hypothetical protein SGRIM128S_07344 [Streptomyces griseomycini]
MADVVGPGGATVGLAGEGIALGRGLGRPGAVQAGGRERAEVPALRADRLDDHEVAVLALQLVDLRGFEQVVRRVAHDHRRGRAEAAREVPDRHAGTVDLAVVAGEEQVHVRAVTDERLVDGSRSGVGDAPGEEHLLGRPAVRVGGVARRPVGERRPAPLVGEHPDVLRREVEERGCDGRVGHRVLAGRAHLRPVGEQAEVHRTPPRPRVVRGRVDELPAVVGGDGEVLERDPPLPGLRQRARRRPAVARREIARAGGAGADLDELPLLVGAAPVVVLDDVRVVGGGGALHLEGLVAVARDEPHVAVRAVGQPPLLVGGVQVGPLDDRTAVRGGPVVDVQHLARVARLEAVVAVPGSDELPLLLVLVVPGPLGDAGAVAGRQVVDVQGLAAVAVDQHVRGVGVHGRGLGGLGTEEGGQQQQRREDAE